MTRRVEVVFIGESTMDALIGVDDVAAARSFEAVELGDQKWAEWLQQAMSPGRTTLVRPGGSIANACAAFVDSRACPNAQCTFISVTTKSRAQVSQPFWWRGFDESSADLAERCVRIVGVDRSDQMPELPGAAAFVSGSRATRLVANTTRSRLPRCPRGDLLVARSDHLTLAGRERLRSFSMLAILISDDLTGIADVSDIVSSTPVGWVFGSAVAVAALRSRVDASQLSHLTIVETNGSDACQVHHNGAITRLPVSPIDIPGSDLGAGDAYMGGFLAAAASGHAIERCHKVGCTSAALALQFSASRPPADPDPQAYRSVPASRVCDTSTGSHLYTDVRCSPGVTVITGGQTGIDTMGAQSSLAVGLPTHVIFPSGLRQEDGPITESRRRRLTGARLHELTSASFRTRTWAGVHVSDAVVLLDYGGGDGSEETRVAAQELQRALLECTLDSLVTAAEMGRFLIEHGVRCLLVAGSRGSLLSPQQRRAARAQLSELAEAACEVNRCRLGSMGTRRSVKKGSVAVPSRFLISPKHASMRQWLGPGCRVVALKSARDCASALANGLVDAAVTWPSLMPYGGAYDVEPMGMEPIHYGFVVRDDDASEACLCGVQYSDAFRRNVPWAARLREVPIRGGAENWLEQGLLDILYDTFRTGRSAGFVDDWVFYPTHWETLSIVSAQ